MCQNDNKGRNHLSSDSDPCNHRVCPRVRLPNNLPTQGWSRVTGAPKPPCNLSNLTPLRYIACMNGQSMAEHIAKGMLTHGGSKSIICLTTSHPQFLLEVHVYTHNVALDCCSHRVLTVNLKTVYQQQIHTKYRCMMSQVYILVLFSSYTHTHTERLNKR